MVLVFFIYGSGICKKWRKDSAPFSLSLEIELLTLLLCLLSDSALLGCTYLVQQWYNIFTFRKIVGHAIKVPK